MPRRVERRETPERLGRAETRGGARARGRTAELVVPRSMPTTFSARMPMGIAARRPITARALSWRVLPWKAPTVERPRPAMDRRPTRTAPEAATGWALRTPVAFIVFSREREAGPRSVRRRRGRDA